MATKDKKDHKSITTVKGNSEPKIHSKSIKKVRLFSQVNLKVPMPSELVMILPSLSFDKPSEELIINEDNSDAVVHNNIAASSTNNNQLKRRSPVVGNIITPSNANLQSHTASQIDDNNEKQSTDLHSSHHLSTKLHPIIHYFWGQSSETSALLPAKTVSKTVSPQSQVTAQPTVTYIDETFKGKYGSLHVDVTGKYTFTLDPKAPAYILLKKQEPGTDTFILHLSNGSSVIIQIPVQGKQESPTISGDLHGQVTEDHNIDSHGLISTSGKIDVVDPDHGESGLQAETITGQYGTLTINADGHWQYQVNNSQSNIQALTNHNALHESFTVHTKDGTAQVLNMSIGGSDDNAIITGGTGNVVEDHQVSVSGQLSINDPDANQDHFIADQITGQFGHLDFDKDGSWHYILDNNSPHVQQLNVSEHPQDVFTIQSADGTTHSIKITVSGTNDGPTLQVQSQTVNEDGAKLTGQMVGHDIDHGAVLTYSIPNAVDGLTFNTDGSYSFDPSHASYQALAQGQTQTLTIPVTVTDEHGVSATQNLEIVITGTNDAAKVAGVDTGDVAENQAGQNMSPDYAQPGMAKISHDALTTSGQLSIVDPDTNEATFDTKGGVYSYHGQYGHLLLRSDGHWEYAVAAGQTDWQQKGASTTVGSTIDKLGAGETLTDTITIHTKDGTSHDIVITIHGDNDVPYVSGDVQLNTGKEDLPQTLTQEELLVNSVDVDHNDLGKLSIANLHADHGSILDNKDGTYTFTPDKDYNGQVHFTYDVKDAHGGTTHSGASLTLTPTPDNAQISYASTDNHQGGVTEDRYYIDTHDNLHFDGKLAIVDPDKGEAQFDINLGPQTYQGIGYDTKLGGHILLMQDGRYTYTIRDHQPLVQELKQGETITDECVVKSQDGTTFTIQVNIHGTNDAPTLSAQHQSVTEDGSLLSGQMVGQDIDHGASLTYSITNPVDGLTFHTDGSYRFDPSHANYQSLAQGQTQTVTIPVTVTDEHGASATQNLDITVVGTNDAAQISGRDSGDVYESTYADRSPDYQRGNISHLWNDSIHTSGKLDIIDHDSGEAHFDNNAPAYQYFGQYGRLILQTDGNWSYYADVGNSAVGRKIDALNTGQELTDTITVQSADGTTHDVVITIHGDNDSPFVSSEVQLNSGKEDLPQTITQVELLANSMDVDSNDAGKLTIENLRTDHGSILDNQDGTYTFTPDKDYSGQVHFTYDVKDAHTGVTHTDANMTLIPTGDAAQFSGIDSGSLTEDRHVQGDAQHTIFTTGVLNVADPDAGEDHFHATRHAHALHDPYGGTLTIGKAGDWTYSVPNGNVQHLGQGESAQVQYEVQSAGGDKHTITLTIHGTNDDPTVSADVQLNIGREDATQIITSADLLANATDVDSNDVGQLSISNLTVNHGSILDNGDGTFTLVPEKDFNGQLHFQYQVHDHHGGVALASASMSVVAVNDQPDVQPLTDSVKEDSTSHHLVDLLTGATDKEGDALSVSQIRYSVDGSTATTALPDGFALGPDGHSLTIDATHSAFQHLSAGQTQKVVVNYLVDDGHGGQTPQSATLTIEGADDKAVLTSNVIQMTESQALTSKTSTYHGQLQLTDMDTGDNTEFVFSGRYMGQGYAPGYLYIWPDGSYEFSLQMATNRHASDLVNSLHQGETMEVPYQVRTSDGQKLTVIVKIIGEDDQARIAVGQYSSLNNHAYEDNLSPGSTRNQVWSGGNLHIIDPDHGQAGFVAQSFDTPEGGHFSINVRGGWQYTIDNAKLQHLGEGQSYQKTFTVESIDGTAHRDITVTVHGTNDTPVVTSSVTLSQGTEDTSVILKASDLLAHASDVDDNTQLTVQHLTADHGQIVDNHDGTFTFTPEQDYHGQVHFTYDVKDEHGASVSTSATMNLAAVNDAATFTGYTGSITEDTSLHHNLHISGASTIQDALTCNGHLVVSDADGQGEAALDLNGQHHLTQSGTYGQFVINSSGTWVYAADNNNVAVQDLDNGQTLTDHMEVTSKDGTKHSITVTINGTTDKPVLHSLSDSGVQHSGSIEGNLLSGVGTHEGASGAATDTDSNAHLMLQDIQIKAPTSGYVTVTPGHPHTMAGVGTLTIEANGHYTFTPEAGFTGKVPSMIYRVGDDGGNPIGDSSQNILTLEVTPAAPITPTLVAAPQITGGAGHQDLHASLGTPPQHQTGGSQHNGWGIFGSGGHIVTSLHGQFGTLHVDPHTGHLDYDYSTSSGVIKTHSGGSYGSGTDETDSFVLTLDGAQNSQIAVHLHLHSQSIHGNSGHHIDVTTLTGMDVSPLAPPPPPPPISTQADEPMDSDSLDVDLTSLSGGDIDNEAHLVQQEHHSSHEAPQHGAAAYLSALGIEPTQTFGEASQQSVLPDDIDIVLADDSQPVDSLHLDADNAAELSHQVGSQDDKHDDLINPDEHHDQGDPSSFIDPY